MDEKADEGTEVVGQSSMEELDYEASDNLEEESMESQSENNTNSNGATEETVKAENDETENVLATAVAGDSVDVREDSKENQSDSKTGNDTEAKKKSSEFLSEYNLKHIVT